LNHLLCEYVLNISSGVSFPLQCYWCFLNICISSPDRERRGREMKGTSGDCHTIGNHVTSTSTGRRGSCYIWFVVVTDGVLRWCQYHLPKQLKKTVLGKRTSGDGIRVKEDQIPSWMYWTVSVSTTELFDNLRPDDEDITWFNTDVSHWVVVWLTTRSCRSELKVSGGRYCDPSLVEEEWLVNTWPDGLDSEGSEGEAAQLQSIIDYSWPDAGVVLEIEYKVSYCSPWYYRCHFHVVFLAKKTLQKKYQKNTT
jgi:hypothetical protein